MNPNARPLITPQFFSDLPVIECLPKKDTNFIKFRVTYRAFLLVCSKKLVARRKQVKIFTLLIIIVFGSNLLLFCY